MRLVFIRKVRLPSELWFVQLQMQMITIWILSVNLRVSMG